MNKYKIVCIVLAASLFGALARLVFISNNQQVVEDTPEQTKVEVILENIHSRKSTRSFTDQQVSREQIDTLVRAAMAAPTGWNLRPWRFIVLDDREVLNKLASKLSHSDLLKKAPAAIIVCGDTSIKDPQGNADLWTYDCSAASENLLLAAEAIGLGAVWTKVSPDATRISTIQEELNMPEHIIPLNIIPVGYPKEIPAAKDKYNADNIHFNKW